MDELLKILHFLNLEYILSVNLVSYFIIRKLFSLTNKYIKLIVTFVIGSILSYIYYKFSLIEIRAIIPSFVVSIVMYDYVIKYILSMFKNLSYRK